MTESMDDQPAGAEQPQDKGGRKPLTPQQRGCYALTALFVIPACALIFFGVVLDRGPGGSGHSPTNDTACGRAFAAAAAKGDFEDTVSDLDPAVMACGSLAEWKAAAAVNPGAISDGVDPIGFLVTRCTNTPALAGLPLCRAALGQ